MRETMLLEQARSLAKDDAVTSFIKQTSKLNVYVNSESGFVPPSDDDQDTSEENQSPGSTGRRRKESKITHDQLVKQ